jgi:hypothetical protein
MRASGTDTLAIGVGAVTKIRGWSGVGMGGGGQAVQYTRGERGLVRDTHTGKVTQHTIFELHGLFKRQRNPKRQRDKPKQQHYSYGEPKLLVCPHVGWAEELEEE